MSQSKRCSTHPWVGWLGQVQQTQLAAYPITIPLSSLPTEPSVRCVCSARGDCDWSKPIAAAFFPSARRQVFQLVSPKGKPLEAPGKIFPAKREQRKEESSLYLPFFLPPWHGSMWGHGLTCEVSAAILHLWGNLFPKPRNGQVGGTKEAGSSLTTASLYDMFGITYLQISCHGRW